MYTCFTISRESAFLLFQELGAVSYSTSHARSMSIHTFEELESVNLTSIGAKLDKVAVGDYKLSFDRFLPELPEVLGRYDIAVGEVELVRRNSTPTLARPGYYHHVVASIEIDTEATVEQFVLSGHNSSGEVVQNITVTGALLADVIKFHGELVQGHALYALVHVF